MQAHDFFLLNKFLFTGIFPKVQHNRKENNYELISNRYKLSPLKENIVV